MTSEDMRFRTASGSVGRVVTEESIKRTINSGCYKSKKPTTVSNKYSMTYTLFNSRINMALYTSVAGMQVFMRSLTDILCFILK